MPNPYFQFKQFNINQGRCAMKVCTDACLFGAWVAEYIATRPFTISNCLDIGTGTGLLAIMIAQKNENAYIDAVEINGNAYRQSAENFKNTNWHSRLRAHHDDITQFAPEKKYDLIISNPPFYENELRSAQKNKNVAKHDAGLRLDELIAVIATHLAFNGHFAILLPYQRVSYFEGLAKQHGFFCSDKLLVRQTPGHDFFRGILFFGIADTPARTQELSIKDNEGNYLKEFTMLLKDYYLKL